MNQNSGFLYNTSTPKGSEIKDITDSKKSASYLGIRFEIDGKGNLVTKRGDFSFRITNSPFICGNITSAPAY